MSNPQDPTKNHPDKIASNNKVIVLSMKNMASFKFDPSKNFLATSNVESGQSVFNFKPQQLIQPSVQQIVATQPKVQVVQQPASQAISKIGTAGTILIRAQSATTSSTMTSKSSQFAALTTCPNVKIQEAPVKVQANVNKEVSSSSSSALLAFASFRNKVSNEITMKTQSGQTVLIQPSTVVKAQTPFVPIQTGSKTISFTTTTSEPTPPLRRISMGNIRMAPKDPAQSPKPVSIRPKIDTTKVNIVQQHVIMSSTRSPGVQKYPTMYPVPALTLIQPKPIVEKVVQEVVEKMPEVELIQDEEEEEIVEDEPAMVEKTPEKGKRTASQEERMLEVRRIIEGDLIELIPQEASEEEQNSAETDSSSALLLCDERIESVSTEISPNESEKSKEVTTTPALTDDESKISEKSASVQEVRKNLQLSLECDKENVDIVLDDESISDTSSMTDNQRQKMQDYEESLTKSEIVKLGATEHLPPVSSTFSHKPKRIRKPKNPTIISTLGLPYKPSQPSNRKTKVEKKLEFELDFHDPLNKIQWDDGIGGLDNCRKLFGFDEFGLIEVINKKDAMAKLKLFDVKQPAVNNGCKEETSYKLRKIVERADQFVCTVCSKHGTIRDFYTPECCSEACIAITKRKAQGELSSSFGKESSSESGMTTPVDERKLMFAGELVPLQQLQQHLLELELPPSKRKRLGNRAFAPIVETKFLWDTYLTPKSVPAAVELFKNPYPYKLNPFKVGMKLEAIDPENQKMFCVCTVEEKLGYRVKLHFDGYSTAYDFWVNADSPNIFPSGFCHSTGRVLQTPPKWSNKKFDWSEYLDHTNSIGAQRAMFPRLARVSEDNLFEIGMKLETMREGKLYAASIIDVIEDRVLISYDGHEELGCVWIETSSSYLHPCNYHKTLPDPECFIPPSRPFTWTEYLKATGSVEAPSEFLFFRKRKPFKFEAGLKLEVVDKVNRQLIRPATVLCRDEFKIQVIFDGFDINFAYWLDDDSEDIHPINWCEKTGHPIEHPAGVNKSQENGLCPSPGCRGIGNASHVDHYFHDNWSECPYNKIIWKKLLNQKRGSHLDSKTVVKRGKQSGGRRASMPHKEELKIELEIVEETSMDVDEIPAAPIEKVTKKRGKKRKAVNVEIKEEEVAVPVSVANSTEDQANKIKVSQEFLEDYGPQLNYSFELWKKNSSVLDRVTIDGNLTENPLTWSTFNVCTFIEKITSDTTVVEKFNSNEIDGAAFVCLCQNDLVDLLGLKIGVAIKIFNRIMHLRQEITQKFMKI